MLKILSGRKQGEHCLSNKTLETLKEEKRAQLRKDVDIVGQCLHKVLWVKRMGSKLRVVCASS